MRRLANFLRDVVESTVSRPGRVALALLALFTGSFALAVLASVLRGLDERARRIESDFGANAFALLPAGGAQRDAREIPPEALARLEAAAPLLQAAGVRGARANTRAGDLTLAIAQADPALADIRPFRRLEGRLLDGIDQRERARVAVISAGVRQRLGVGVGDTLYLGAEPFEVVGVAEFPSTAVPGVSLDPAVGVWIPRTTPAYWQGDDLPSDGMHAVWVRYPPTLPRERAMARTRDLLTGHGLDPDRCSWVTSDALLEPLRRWRDMIRLTAGSVSVFCLLLGGATLMSLMVANVQERIPEIGLRRSLGATRASIARLFLAEAALLTGLAATLGSLAAVPLAGLPWLRSAGLPYAVDALTLSLPLAASLALGCLFAAGPAWRASRVPPAEALRVD